MTDEKEGPVHYQVSVTGRQAAAFFLVLLAALGLSYFFGMKTGAAAKRGPDTVSALAAQSDIAVPTVAAGGDSGEKAVPVPTEVPIGFETRPAEPKKAAVVEPAPVKVEEKAAPKEEPAAAPKGSTKPPAKAAEPPSKPAAEAAPAPAKEPAAKKDDGPFWVQIVVTSNAEKADGLSKKLKADGFKPVVSPVTGQKGLSFRVRVGPYPDRAKAEAAAKHVEKAEKLQTKPIVVPGT